MSEILNIGTAAATGTTIGGAIIGWLAKITISKLIEKYEETLLELRQSIQILQGTVNEIQNRITTNNESSLRSIAEVTKSVAKIEGVLQGRQEEATKTQRLRNMDNG